VQQYTFSVLGAALAAWPLLCDIERHAARTESRQGGVAPFAVPTNVEPHFARFVRKNVVGVPATAARPLLSNVEQHAASNAVRPCDAPSAVPNIVESNVFSPLSEVLKIVEPSVFSFDDVIIAIGMQIDIKVGTSRRQAKSLSKSIHSESDASQESQLEEASLE
jgi:hypothetical protein